MTNYWSKLANSRLARRRVLIAAGGGLGAAAFLAACGDSETKQQQSVASLLTEPVDRTKDAVRGGTLQSHQRNDVQNFDPLFTSAPTQFHALLVYNRLVRPKYGKGQAARSDDLTGDLAQSWEVSPDKLTMTMKLRPGVKWHNLAPVNGRAFSSQDVAYTWERFAKTGTNRSLFASALNPAAPIESLKATDDQTIVIKTAKPYAALLPLLSYPQVGSFYILPTEAENGFDVRKTMIGTGHLYQASHQPSTRTTYKRNEAYWDKDAVLVDTVEMPLITEYAAGLAQFRAGQVWDYPINSDDILRTKQDDGRLSLMKEDLLGPLNVAFFGWNPAYGNKTPFRDERVRQAFSMSWDRDLWIDTRYNVSKFKDAGLPAEMYWNTSVRPLETGWWLNPKDKEFGPNARFYVHNLEEAKKLLAAAGHPSGLDFDANYVTTGQYGVTFNAEVEMILGFVREAGFRPKVVPSNFNAEWRPKFADSKGDFEGIAFRLSPDGSHPSVPEQLFLGFHHDSGLLYTGMFSEGSSFQKGDPKLEDLIEKARGEFDNAKQRALVGDVQRLEAKAQYRPRLPGVGTTFRLGWPVIANDYLYRGISGDLAYKYLWIDKAKAPLT